MKRPLQLPYDSPYAVLKLTENQITIRRQVKDIYVSIDKVKQRFC